MLYKKRWIFIFICDKKTDKKFAGDVIMTKEKFKNYNKENTFCDSCKQLLPTKYFSYSYIILSVLFPITLLNDEFPFFK